MPLPGHFNIELVHKAIKRSEDECSLWWEGTDSEYDQDIAFHRLLSRHYQHLVSDPNLADIFYVPFYFRRRGGCHPSRNESSLLQEFSVLFASWAQQYPPRFGRPRFFITAGAVCSCTGEGSQCNPLSDATGLHLLMRIVAWERTNVDEGFVDNVVWPYISMGLPYAKLNYDVDDSGNGWRRPDAREILVLNTANWRLRQAAEGGICEASKDFPIPSPGCHNLRSVLAAQMVKHEGARDVQFLAARTGDAEKGTTFYPLMGNTTFCLQPPGDTLTRSSFYQSVLCGCIPVVFREDDAFVSQWAFSDRIPYRQLWFHIPESEVLNGLDVVNFLRQVPKQVIRDRQARLVQFAPAFDFFAEDSGRGRGPIDAVSWTVAAAFNEPPPGSFRSLP